MPDSKACRIFLLCLFFLPVLSNALTRLPVLHVVGDPRALSAADSMMQTRLIAVGLDPVLIDDDDATTADADDVILVIIQESCISSRAEGKFKSVPVPVIHMEPFAWDVDCFIDTTLSDTFGITPGPEDHTIEIVDSGRIFSGWKTGDRITYYSGSDRTRNKMGWAVPAGEGFTVARIPGTARSVVFGFEAGEEMANGFMAPARRIGFFLQNHVADSLTDAGWRLFYAVLDWCLEDRREALGIQAALVTKQPPFEYPLGDLILRHRLMNQGFDLRIVKQDEFFTADYSRTDILVISESVDYGMTPDQYHFGVPVLNCEQRAYHMTTPWVTASLASATSLLTDRLMITDPSHEITEGFDGEIRISGRPTFWGGVADPGGDVSVLARYPDTETAALFAYRNTARLLEGRRMQARFIGFPFQADAPKWATESLWLLWDRSLEWALAPDTGFSAIENPDIVRGFMLFSAYPNPFNPGTTIRYQIPVSGHVTLTVYNLLGREVVRLLDREQPAGQHQTVWDGRDGSGKPAAGGVYICRMQAGEFNRKVKLVLAR